MSELTFGGRELPVTCGVCGRSTTDLSTMIDISGTAEPSMVCEDPTACTARADRQGQAPNLRYAVTVREVGGRPGLKFDGLSLAGYVKTIADYIVGDGSDDHAIAEALAVTRRPTEVSIDVGAGRQLELVSSHRIG